MMFDRPTFSAGAVYIDPDVNVTGRSNQPGKVPTRIILRQQRGFLTCTSLRRSTISSVGGIHYLQLRLATEFNKDYSAGIYGGKTDLQTVNLNLSGAYRLNNSWSFGVGFDAVYAKAKLSATRVPSVRCLHNSWLDKAYLSVDGWH